MVRERLRLWFRALMYWRATAHLAQFFQAPEHRPWLQWMPQILEKPHRPYLLASLSALERAQLVCTHYELTEASAQRELLRAAAAAAKAGGCPLAVWQGRSGQSYALSLASCDELPKEGELVLSLSGGALPAYRLAFTLGLREGLRVAYIGCLQGPSGPHMRETVRQATWDLQGERPRDLLLAMAQELFERMQVQTILGVASAGHIYQSWRLKRRVALNYDSLWSEMGGTRYSVQWHRLPLRHVLRPLSEYPSKKRAQASRRQALLREGARQVQESISRAARP